MKIKNLILAWLIEGKICPLPKIGNPVGFQERINQFMSSLTSGRFEIMVVIPQHELAAYHESLAGNQFLTIIEGEIIPMLHGYLDGAIRRDHTLRAVIYEHRNILFRWQQQLHTLHQGIWNIQNRHPVENPIARWMHTYGRSYFQYMAAIGDQSHTILNLAKSQSRLDALLARMQSVKQDKISKYRWWETSAFRAKLREWRFNRLKHRILQLEAKVSAQNTISPQSAWAEDLQGLQLELKSTLPMMESFRNYFQNTQAEITQYLEESNAALEHGENILFPSDLTKNLELRVLGATFSHLLLFLVPVSPETPDVLTDKSSALSSMMIQTQGDIDNNLGGLLA